MTPRRSAVAVVIAAAVVAASTAAGADPVAPVAPPALSAPRRAAAITLAIVPGVAIRGLGSAVARAPATGHRLLTIAGVGLGLVVVGGAPIAATYGSAKVLVPGVHLLVAGTGLVFASWWSDLWVAAGGARLHGGPRTRPALEVGLAASWQHDGFHGDRLHATPQLIARAGRWELAATAFTDDDAGTFGGRAEVGARLWGRHGDVRTVSARHTATFVEARGAAQVVHEPDDRLTLATLELELRARVDLAHVDRHLRGTFFELSEGLGLETATYRPGGTDGDAILLSRFTWGVFLPCGRGEVAAWYDHRRDQLAGGLPAGRAAGFFGSVGADAEIVVSGGVTLTAEVELGSSWLTTVGVRKEIR